MGKNREEFQKKLQQRLMEREKRKAMGLDSDTESDTGTAINCYCFKYPLQLLKSDSGGFAWHFMAVGDYLYVAR